MDMDVTKILSSFKQFSTTCFSLYDHHHLWCRNCSAYLVLFLVWSHVCAGVSLGDGLLSLCVARVLL
jgi:hypothetical protein